MATQLYTTSHDKSDSGLSLVADLIAAHRQAYAAWIAARDKIHALHGTFDPEHLIEDSTEIADAVRAHYASDGDGGETSVLFYSDMAAVADKAAWAEDDAWKQVASFEPRHAADLQSWLGYVVRHARIEDETVTLRQALEHVAGQLGERLM